MTEDGFGQIKYLLRHTTKEAKAIVRELRYQVDLETLHKEECPPPA